MDAKTVLGVIAALAQTARVLAPEIERAIEVLKSHDGEEVKAALTELRAAGDALHERVHAKLAAAAQT